MKVACSFVLTGLALTNRVAAAPLISEWTLRASPLVGGLHATHDRGTEGPWIALEAEHLPKHRRQASSPEDPGANAVDPEAITVIPASAIVDPLVDTATLGSLPTANSPALVPPASASSDVTSPVPDPRTRAPLPTSIGSNRVPLAHPDISAPALPTGEEAILIPISDSSELAALLGLDEGSDAATDAQPIDDPVLAGPDPSEILGDASALAGISPAVEPSVPDIPAVPAAIVTTIAPSIATPSGVGIDPTTMVDPALAATGAPSVGVALTSAITPAAPVPTLPTAQAIAAIVPISIASPLNVISSLAAAVIGDSTVDSLPVPTNTIAATSALAPVLQSPASGLSMEPTAAPLSPTNPLYYIPPPLAASLEGAASLSTILPSSGQIPDGVMERYDSLRPFSASMASSASASATSLSTSMVSRMKRAKPTPSRGRLSL